jgi:hypothetical protein
VGVYAMTRPKEVIEDWINQVNEKGLDLTKWEEDFMEFLTEQFKNRGSVSDKQEEILERIYTDRT